MSNRRIIQSQGLVIVQVKDGAGWWNIRSERAGTQAANDILKQG